jgi:hypothetical protein
LAFVQIAYLVGPLNFLHRRDHWKNIRWNKLRATRTVPCQEFPRVGNAGTTLWQVGIASDAAHVQDTHIQGVHNHALRPKTFKF